MNLTNVDGFEDKPHATKTTKTSPKSPSVDDVSLPLNSSTSLIQQNNQQHGGKLWSQPCPTSQPSTSTTATEKRSRWPDAVGGSDGSSN
jgi:hypothetical protein